MWGRPVELIIYIWGGDLPVDAKKIGRTIKVLRSRIGYTQHDLADALGVTDKAVSKWERGLSVPDIAIVTQLSLILNCDVDNLLEGNITFLEKSWQGLLVINDENQEIFCGTMMYSKPLVYFLLSYFMLAGIRNIYVKCSEKDEKFIEDCLGTGKKIGVSIKFISTVYELDAMNTMVVFDNPFVYGPNLTKYFQRAMSRPNRISVLTTFKGKGGNRCSVDFDNCKVMQLSESGNCYYAPILFVPDNCIDRIAIDNNFEDLIKNETLYAEPMGNGMIEYSVKTQEDVYQTAGFIRYLETMMGNEIYDLNEIAKRRNLI